MTSPDHIHYDFEPSQDEIRKLHNKIQAALELNPRLNVRQRSDNYGIKRDFRHTFISGLEVELLLGDTEYDEIGIESRISPEDADDPFWVRIDLQTHGEDPGLGRIFEYMIDYGMEHMNKWSIRKRLPKIDEDESQNQDYENMTDEEIALYEHFEKEVSSITPQDVDFLHKLAESLSQ